MAARAYLSEPTSVSADTTVPGHTRRLVWGTPEIVSHSLIALTLTKLYLAPAGAVSTQETIHAIQNGADLDAAFGPLVTVVELQHVLRVRLELITNMLLIEYRAGTRSTTRLTIECQSHETADEIYTKLWRRLGERFEGRVDKADRWEVARGPVMVMAVILLLVPVLALIANAASDGNPANIDRGFGLQRIFTLIDWRVICGIGGGMLAILQVWLYRGLTHPPSRLELVAQYAAEDPAAQPASINRVKTITP